MRLKPLLCLLALQGCVTQDVAVTSQSARFPEYPKLLFSALESGKLAAAGLDVYMGEPALDARFLGHENIVLAPHLGSATEATRVAMGHRAIDNLKAFLAGETPGDLVT